MSEDQLYASLDHFLGDLGGRYPLAIEIRTSDWLHDEYFSILKAHRAAHVFQVDGDASAPRGVGTVPPVVGGWVHLWSVEPWCVLPCDTDAVDAFTPYDRLREPSQEIRRSIFGLLHEAERLNVPVYTTVNNRLEGCAPLTVSEMRAQWATDSQGDRPCLFQDSELFPYPPCSASR